MDMDWESFFPVFQHRQIGPVKLRHITVKLLLDIKHNYSQKLLWMKKDEMILENRTWDNE